MGLIVVIVLAMVVGIPMAFAFGGGGHGGGGHSSGHASGHAGGEGHSSAHESVSEGGHESVSAPRRTNPFIIIPHGSSTAAACPNGVASEVQGTASETAVMCYSDPAPKEDSGNKTIAVAFFGLVACMVAAILLS